MQVLSASLRALSFCLGFFSGKLARIKSNFASLLKYKIQDVTPTMMCDPYHDVTPTMTPTTVQKTASDSNPKPRSVMHGLRHQTHAERCADTTNCVKTRGTIWA